MLSYVIRRILYNIPIYLVIVVVVMAMAVTLMIVRVGFPMIVTVRKAMVGVVAAQQPSTQQVDAKTNDCDGDRLLKTDRHRQK